MSKTKKRSALSSAVANALSQLSAGGKTIFELGDFAQALDADRVRARKVLHQIHRGGWVIQIARGRYLIVPLEAGPEGTWSEDSFVIGCRLARHAAVAYWSACHYWNWTEQVPRTTVVQTPQRTWSRSRTILGVRYRLVLVRAGKFFGTLERSSGHGRFVITDQEKTLVDCIDHPEWCGGIQHVMQMLPVAAESVRWDRAETYMVKLGSGAVMKRLGFLAEYLGDKMRLPDRKKRLARWRSGLTGGVAPLEPGATPEGQVNSRWRIRVNAPGLKPRRIS